MSSNYSVSRRLFLQTTVGTAVVAGTAPAVVGTAAAQSQEPDFSELAGVDGGIADLRDQDEVTVDVGVSGNGGDLAFRPAGIWIDPGTTVVWEWTGAGGTHNVVTTAGPAPLASDLSEEASFTYEFEFTEDHAGITNYECQPHASLGMLGAVAVGDDVPTTDRADQSDETAIDSVDDAEEPDTEDTGSTETAAENGTDDDMESGSTSNNTPGFGIVGTLAAVGGASYLLRGRLSDET